MRFLIFCLISVKLMASPDVLMYAQDAGETYAFLPVFKRLQEVSDVLLLTGGTACEIAEKEGVDHKKISDVIGREIPKTWDRSTRLTNGEIRRLLTSYHPSVFITGVAFEIQGQMLDAFPCKTIAYWDNFSEYGETPYFQTAHAVYPRADVLFVPSSDFTISENRVVVGQPSLDSWKFLTKEEDSHTLVFIGGYGKDYEDAFRLFLKCIEDNTEYDVIISPHPKTKGSFERREAEGMNIKVSNEPTKNVVRFSCVVVCHQSTVGIQAQFAGKPVIYVIPEDQSYSNPILIRGLAPQVKSKEEFQKALVHSKESIVSLFDAFHVPENGVEEFTNAVVSYLNLSE